jgi:hypothetical protein
MRGGPGLMRGGPGLMRGGPGPICKSRKSYARWTSNRGFTVFKQKMCSPFTISMVMKIVCDQIRSNS